MLLETVSHAKRRRRSVEEKRRIVEETLEAGASVACVARRHAINANQVFYWCKQYREGGLGKSQSSKLLPVTLSDPKSGGTGRASSPFAVGTMEITLAKRTLRVAGDIDVVALRTAKINIGTHEAISDRTRNVSNFGMIECRITPGRNGELVEGKRVAVDRFFQNCHLLCPPWRVGQTSYLFDES